MPLPKFRVRERVRCCNACCDALRTRGAFPAAAAAHAPPHAPAAARHHLAAGGGLVDSDRESRGSPAAAGGSRAFQPMAQRLADGGGSVGSAHSPSRGDASRDLSRDFGRGGGAGGGNAGGNTGATLGGATASFHTAYGGSVDAGYDAAALERQIRRAEAGGVRPAVAHASFNEARTARPSDRFGEPLSPPKERRQASGKHGGGKNGKSAHRERRERRRKRRTKGKDRGKANGGGGGKSVEKHKSRQARINSESHDPYDDI